MRYTRADVESTEDGIPSWAKWEEEREYLSHKRRLLRLNSELYRAQFLNGRTLGNILVLLFRLVTVTVGHAERTDGDCSRKIGCFFVCQLRKTCHGNDRKRSKN